MATEKQTNANRQNAKKSTGPRTREGKRRVSRNALKHGLSASQVLMPGEDQAEFERLRDGFVDVLDPRDEVELALVRQMVSAEWRLRRIDRLEASTVKHCMRLRKPFELKEPPDRRIPGTPEELDAQLADIVFYAECVQGDAISKYARYSSIYTRQFHRARKLLKEKQAEAEMPEPTETDNGSTKPISDNFQEIQQDTAAFTKSSQPHGPPDPAQDPGNQPQEGR